MGADYSFELISIETYTSQFNGYNELFLDSGVVVVLTLLFKSSLNMLWSDC